MRRADVFLCVVLLVVVPALAYWPQNPPAIPTENDALALAAADIATIPVYDRTYIRYVWATPSETQHEDMQCLSLVLNYISRATVIVRPVPLGKDRLMVIRLDMRHYWPKGKDLSEAVATWEEFRFDPHFNMLLTRDTLKFAIGVDLPKGSKSKTKKREFADQRSYKDAKTGAYLGYWDEVKKTYHPNPWVEEVYQEQTGLFDGGEDVVRVVAPHLDPTLVASLVEQTRSQAPVVNSGYFMTRALTTIQDKGVYRTVYSGLYYQLANIPKAGKKGTDEDALFKILGVGDPDVGITAQRLYDEVRSDQRVAVFRSGVTGRPRRADVLKTLAGMLSVTHDLKAGSIDVGTHPMMNLLDFQDDARELIFEKVNGLHGFALFNGKGVRQDVVPPDVAFDGTVPFPNRAELQPAIGCVRCHAGESGWRILTNDVKVLVKDADIFGDRKGGYDQADVIDRLAGLYAGDLEQKILPRGRDDYNSAILAATGPWKTSKKAQADIATLTGAHIAGMFARYNYEQVDAKRALWDLGVEVKDAKEAPKMLKKLLPPVPIDAGGFVREDPRLVALFAGLRINRSDYDLMFSFIAARAAKARVKK